MGAQRRLLPVVAITGSSVLVGCAGGYGYGYGAACGPYGSCGCYGTYGSYGACPFGPGIYEGTLSHAASKMTTPVVALVPESGPALLSAQDGSFYRLNVDAAGGSASGTYRAFSTAGALPNGSDTDAGNASLMAGAKDLIGTLIDQLGNKQSLNLAFDARYKAPAPSGALVGTWYNPTANGLTLTLSINADGSLSGNDSNGCAYAGNLNGIDPRLALFKASFTRNCSSGTVTFAGLVSYLPSTGTTPTQLELMADDPGGDYLALMLQPG